MDLFSQIMSGTRLANSLFCAMSLGEHAAVDYESGPASAAHHVIAGECLLLLPPDPPVRLRAGDLVLLPFWPPHALATDPAAAPQAIRQLVRAEGQPLWQAGELLDRPIILACGTGPARCEVLSMVFRVDDPSDDPFLRSLPRRVLMQPVDATTAALLATVRSFVAAPQERGTPGYGVVANRLADLLHTQILRQHLRERPEELTGLLRGLADPALARLLAALHADPGQRWSVAGMAREAGLSRSLFAARFQAMLGETPKRYLTRLRMRRAARMLEEGRRVKEAAAAAGFLAGHAFAQAFRRSFGSSPDAYRKARRASPP